MLNVLLLSVIMIFFTIGVYFFTKTVTSSFLKNEYESLVVIKTAESPNKIEGIVRNAAFANPNSEILVLCKCQNSETQYILDKISQKNNRIHIRNILSLIHI